MPFYRRWFSLSLLLALFAGTLVSAHPAFDPNNPPTSATPPTIPYQRYTGAFSHQKGPKTMMFIYVRPSDGQTPSVKTFAQLSAELDSTSQAYYDASYRQTWFGPVVRNSGQANEFIVPRLVVTPVVDLPGTVQTYLGSFSTLQSHAQAAVRALGGDYAAGQPLDPANFDRIQVFGSPKLISSTGLAFVGGRFSWSGNSLSGGVVQHELGHNWGVEHANLWQGADGIPRNSVGTHSEYADGSDVMGGGNTLFNAMFRDQLGFLERGRGEVDIVTTSDTYRLFAFTNPESRRPETNVRALLLPVEGIGSSQKHKFLSFRFVNGTDGGLSRNDWERNAVQVHSNRTSSVFSENWGSHFLDTTPRSRSGGLQQDRNDGAIKIGRTYSEGPTVNGNHIYGGVHITPIGRGSFSVGGFTHEYIDVVVNYGNSVSPGNQPSVASFSQSVHSVAVNTPLTLSVTASDPEGDAMAFDWEFGDERYNLVSAPTQTVTWSTPGFYLIRCTVSDMKGGVTDAYNWVNVGAQPYAAPAPAPSLEGLHYRYYEGSWTSLPNLDLLLPLTSGTVSSFDISPRQRNNNFAMLFTGFIDIPAQDVYQFRIRHDDGVRLIIGGQTAINRPQDFGSPEESSGNIALQAGLHPVRLEYFHRIGTETLDVRIWTATGGEIPLPGSWLRQESWAGNAAPEVAITSPGPGESTVVNSDLLIQADASDDQGIARVVFFGDGAFLGQALSPPYEVIWEKVSAGTKILTAVAYDVTGRYTISVPVSLDVQSPPPAQGFGLNFGAQNDSTRIQFGERAGAVYPYSNWNNLAGDDAGDIPVIDHLGYATPIRVSYSAVGAGSGTFQNSADTATANGRMMRGGLNLRHDIEPAPVFNPHADVHGIPYPVYDVYVYFDYQNNNVDDTIVQRFALTPTEGPAPAARFGRNSASHTNGKGDFPEYDTFSGFREATATALNAPDAELFGNYVVFRNQTAPGFRIEATRNNPATFPGNTGRHRRFFNAVQVIERPAPGPSLLVRSVGGELTVSESGQTAAVTVSLAFPPTAPVTVSIQPDSQLTADQTSLVFPPGEWDQARTVVLGAVNDSLAEGEHTGVVTFTTSGGNYSGLDPLEVSVRILDNDLPMLAVTKVSDGRSGASPESGEFQIARSGVVSVAGPLTVAFTLGGNAVPGDDYSVTGSGVSFNAATASGTVVIPAGSAEARVGILPVNAPVSSGDPSVTLTLQADSAYGLLEEAAVLYLFDPTNPRYFTQFFNAGQLAGAFNLAFHTVTFTPDGSDNYYSAAIQPATAFPSPTTGHLNLVANGGALRMGSTVDGFYTVAMPASFYGQTYDPIFVGSNGFVTFDQGNQAFTPTLATHFSRLRVSGYFRDLDPSSQGQLTVGRSAADDRTVVTWANVPRWDNNNERVNVQIEFFDSGVITITWLDCHPGANTPIVGFSNRTTGTPADFVETNFLNFRLPDLGGDFGGISGK